MRRLIAHLRRRLHVLIHPQTSIYTAGDDPKPAARVPAPPPFDPKPAARVPEPPPSNAKPPTSNAKPPTTNAKPATPVSEPPPSNAKPPTTNARPPEPVPAPPPSTAAPPAAAAAVDDDASWQAEDGSCPAPPLVSTVALIVRQAVARLRPPVQHQPLDDNERKRLGGLLFQGAFQFVSRVSALLRERPDLSPDPARINAARLSGRNHRAYGWSVLHALFTDLAELANDCFLHEQGSAIEEAHLVLKAHEIRLDDALLRGCPDPALVKDAAMIHEAQSILKRWERRQHQTQKRHARTLKKAKQKLARSAPPTPSTQDPPRRSAGKRQQGQPILSLAAWGRRASGR